MKKIALILCTFFCCACSSQNDPIAYLCGSALNELMYEKSNLENKQRSTVEQIQFNQLKEQIDILSRLKAVAFPEH